MSQLPSNGLQIIERLYNKHPYNIEIRNALINAYIRLGKHKKSLEMISKIPEIKNDIRSLQFKAWAYSNMHDIKKARNIWLKIIDKTPRTEFIDKSSELIYRSQKVIQTKPQDISLFCVVRNEILRLPFFLKHYRKLGVTNFFFVDNNSDDGSFEFLMKQDDCYVFWTNNSYNESASGIAWIHALLDKYVEIGQWFLKVDADEFLIYPYCEENNLFSLITYLDQHDFNLVSSYMLDMFPKSIKQQLSIKQGDNLFEDSPYFYNNYQLQYRLECPYTRPVGGIFAYFNIPLVDLTKVALFKKQERNCCLVTHSCQPSKLANISSVCLHFKMLGDFQKKSHKELCRKEHARGGSQYRKFAGLYNRSDFDVDFSKLDKTVKYQNSQQLIDLGLIDTSDDWLKFIKDI